MTIKNLTVEEYRDLFSVDALEQMLYIGKRESDPAVQKELRKIGLALQAPRKDPLPYRNTLEGVNMRYTDYNNALFFANDNFEFDPRDGYIQDEQAYI